MIDNKTENLDLDLPDASNSLAEDVVRLIAALGRLDQFLSGGLPLPASAAATTAAPGTNTPQIATTAFVAQAIAALIGSAPGVLDQIAEIATALGEDPNFSVTMATQLALKAPLNSPSLTGTPTATTAAGSDNSTRIATTAFVKALLSGYVSAAGPTFTGEAKFDGPMHAVVNAVAAAQINCSLGNYFTKTATGALTWTVTNVPASRSYHFLLELTNGGLGAQTWPFGTKWPGGAAPILMANGVDVLGFITDDGGASWRGSHLMKDSK